MLNTFSKNIKYIKGKSQSHVERVGEECGLFMRQCRAVVFCPSADSFNLILFNSFHLTE